MTQAHTNTYCQTSFSYMSNLYFFPYKTITKSDEKESLFIQISVNFYTPLV